METLPKPFAFVLMPFKDSFDDVYKLGIKAACEAAGYYCERVDEQIFQGSILDRVYNQISKADIIIADMSEKNPNVYYEVGYAHALGKTTILLTNKSEDIPFDLKHMQHIVYGSSISSVKDELTKKLIWFSDQPKSANSIQNEHFDIFMGQYNLLSQKIILNSPITNAFRLNFTIHNSTTHSILSENYRIGVITSKVYETWNMPDVETILLPDDTHLFLLPPIGNLFPDSYTSCTLDLASSFIEEHVSEFLLRVFSPSGKFDYPFTVSMSQWSTNVTYEIVD
jgi:hypothetical protein